MQQDATNRNTLYEILTEPNEPFEQHPAEHCSTLQNTAKNPMRFEQHRMSLLSYTLQYNATPSITLKQTP